ncbi:uncharacterized protein SPSK_08787 [Sporothrix schenckii 1099-18]|uniref:BTB domain-containing protein n=1 Tax=Sporothrix schenckii 1099-18 TaxID=1397361 RepID=A0A0F2MB73_SPOSC|nr:uncharacterized protein SPSK_08787 [Sporothrix schenckii 1099-18]KJR85426.1 hypothetical protein SPSK_08787 [Sporothrix schenckii 1099-18]
MVSQPDQHFYNNSLAVRGTSSLVGVGVGSGHSHSHSGPPPPTAASVAGGGGHTSSTRSRRYNRSHIGGSSSSSPYAHLNEFPIFTNTGDVEIVVRVRSGHENRYLLHRDTLARCSGFFEASTSKEWSRAQVVSPRQELPDNGDSRALTSGGEVARVRPGGSGSRSGSESGKDGQTASTLPASGQPRRRWRYELDLGEGEHDKPILVQKDESSSSSSSSRTAMSAVDAPQSIFGGGPSNIDNSYSYHNTGGNNGSRAAPTHSNASFFRSVANLALSHSSSRHSNHRDSYGAYNTSSPLLPPPTADEVGLLRDYDNLFRIMYNYPPVLDGVNIADAYVQCKSLLAVADEYDALAFVGPRVDHHLLQFQSRLWRQIAKYPISYLRLGYMARSRVIFQEALVHVVGQWPAGERSLRAALPDSVLDLIEDKVDELAEAVSRVEARLFRLHLTTRGGERVAPSTAYVDWLAVSLFRQWLADNTTPPMDGGSDPKVVIPERRGAGATGDRYGHPRSGPHRGGHPRHDGGRASSSSSSSSGSGRHHQETALTLHVRNALVPALSPPLSTLGRTYRILGLAPSPSYLGHEDCKRFLKLSPDLYTRDNLRRFEKRIDELKVLAREIVRPLMGSGLELDVAGGKSGSGTGSSNGTHDGISYFTCTYLSDRDLPWLVDM